MESAVYEFKIGRGLGASPNSAVLRRGGSGPNTRSAIALLPCVSGFKFARLSSRVRIGAYVPANGIAI